MTDESMLSKAELLDEMQTGWKSLNAYIATLTPAQMTGPTDAAGWTVKDHLIHLAIWEDSSYALLEGLTRQQYMGIDEGTWESGDFDRINAIIQQRFHDMPLETVLRTHDDVHQRLVDKIESLTDMDLYRPYSYYQPGSDWDTPVIGWIWGNSYEHYEEHQPWIAAILEATD